MKPILEHKAKKGILNMTVSIFILVLIIVVISGFTYWFVSEFKDTLAETNPQTAHIYNESGYINSTGYILSHANDLGFNNVVILGAFNATNITEIYQPIDLVNVTVSSTGNVTNSSSALGAYWDNATISYSFEYTGGNAYGAVNDTEAASLNIIDLLPFIFMALGFVIIIGVLIRILVPIMNLGQSFGGGGF